jgi:hypothetical protein
MLHDPVPDTWLWVARPAPFRHRCASPTACRRSPSS